MKNSAIALVAIVASLLASPVDAKKQQANAPIDFSAIRCGEFLQDIANGSEDDAAAVFLWLDGYLSGVSGDTVLRFDSLEQFGLNLVEHCSENGRDRLIDAAREVGIQ